MDQGYVSLVFDCGLKNSIDKALLLLERYELPATFYVFSDMACGGNSEYMDQRHWRELKDRGYEIGAHTKSQRSMTGLRLQEIWREIDGARIELQTLGFNPETFAYPYPGWNPLFTERVKQAGFHAARTMAEGLNDESADPYALYVHTISTVESSENVIEWIDDGAIHGRKWVILCFREIASADKLEHKLYGTTPPAFENILRHLAAAGDRKIPVRRVCEGVDHLRHISARD